MNQLQLQTLSDIHNNTRHIPEIFLQMCSEFKAPRIELDNTSALLKITRIEEVVPFLEEIFTLIETNISSSEPLTMEDLIGKVIHAKNGRNFDTSAQWDSTSFIIIDNNKVVGLCLGHREVQILEDGTRFFTGNGFMPTYVADPIIRNTYKSLLVGLSSSLSLWNAGCKVVRCSTHSTNISAQNLYESVASTWYRDGDFFKYEFDKDKVTRVHQLVLRRSKFSLEKINLLNNLIYGVTNEEI